MKRILIFVYSIVCYVVFLVSFLYSIGFVGNFLVPKSIDSGQEGAFLKSIFIDTILLALFALQHSIMARQGFKKLLIKIIPKEAERSTYVLISSLLLLLLFWQWRPLTGMVWKVENQIGAILFQVLFWIGWVIVLLATYMINHSDLFGLRQSYLYLKNKSYISIKFKTPGLYKVVRHPIMLGFIIAFWATSNMTFGHLLFSILTTGYILIGISFEERDLVNYFGDTYKKYQKQVPMVVPFLKKRV